MFHTVVSADLSEAYVMIFCDTLKIMESVKIIYIPNSLKDLFVLQITSVFICICMLFIFFLKICASGCSSVPFSPVYLGVFVTDRYLNF